LILTLV